MFSDSEVNVTGFDCCPESERLVRDGESQTSNLKTSNEGTQTSGFQTKAAQAGAGGVSGFPSKPPPYDADRLLKFLKRITPQLEEELKDFGADSDGLSFNEDSTGYDGSQELEKTILKQSSFLPDYCQGKVVSNISWNTTGILLAVAYSEKSHEGWCNHETSVGIYNTGKNKFEKHPPEHLLKASSCVRSIQFHPYIPSLIAGGLHSGEVVIWELTNDDTLMTKTKGSGDDEGHTDSVTCLVWREDKNGLWLVTTARDGKIIFWKVTTTNLTYEACERYVILKHPLNSVDIALNDCQEILYISFWPHRESDFVVAAGENLLHCSLRTAKCLPSNPKYKNAVSMKYASHRGLVTCVSCCESSDMLASCGMDSKIQIYRSESSSVLYVIHTSSPTMGVRWTNDHKCLISWGCSSKGDSHRVDVEQGVHVSKTLCEVEEEITTIALNSARHGKMAVGNIKGEIVIFNDVIL